MSRSRISTRSPATSNSVFEVLAVFVFLLSTFHFSNAQFGVVDRRALLQGAARDDGSLSGRSYSLDDVSLAWPALRLGGSNGNDKRQSQEPVQCGMQAHSCLEVGPLGAESCCGNNQYCFFMTNWTLGCCRLGNDCSQATLCKEGSLWTNATISVTKFIMETTTVGPADDPTTRTRTEQVITPSVSPGCGSKPCSSSSFLCQANFGGQCCQYGNVCGSSSQCIADVTAPSPTVVTQIPPECSAATEFACVPGNKTAGCCKQGQTCLGDSFCTGIPLPPGSNATVESSTELSSQAKAGIGAGVAIGAAIVIGLLTWFCVRRRREAVAASRRQSIVTGSQLGQNQNAAALRITGGGIRPGGTISPDLYSGRHERTMSEISGPTSGGMSGNRPPLHQSGLVYDYFGPDAVAGPYTDDPGMTYSEQGPQRHLSRGVPAVPHRPGDISVPVEIGESAASKHPEFLSVRDIGHDSASGDGSFQGVELQGGGEPASYSTTPDVMEAGHYSTAPQPHIVSVGVAGADGINHRHQAPTVTTTTIPTPTANTDLLSSPNHHHDPHHVDIHEMDPQREGPFELAGLYNPASGPMRSYEGEQEAAERTADGTIYKENVTRGKAHNREGGQGQ